MLALFFGFWRLGIEQGANSSAIVNEISPSELLSSGITGLVALYLGCAPIPYDAIAVDPRGWRCSRSLP